MAYHASHSLDAPLRKLTIFAPLTQGEVELVSQIVDSARPARVSQELLSEGEEIKSPLLLVSGWAQSLRILPDGRRQVVCVFVPGDVIGLLRRPRPRGASSVFTLTKALVADASRLLDAMRSDIGGGLSLACLRAEALEQTCMFDHVVRLGRQSAAERMAHFLLEMRVRLQLVGEVDRESFAMPLTQEALADLLGLSVVHVNRTLQQFRREDIVEWHHGGVHLRRPDALAKMVRYESPLARSMDFLPIGGAAPQNETALNASGAQVGSENQR